MTTYSTSLKLSLIGDGEQAGTWGQTTNTNLGTLLEQAITGVVNITMTDANYTLTDLNGVSDEARNAVLIVGGTNTGIKDVIAPAVEKLYAIKNATVGGYAIRIKTSSGAAITIPNGLTTCVYCDGTDFYEQQTGTAGNFTVTGNATVGGTLGVTGALNGSTASFSGAIGGTTATFSGAISSVSPTFTGTPTAPTAAPGTNTTQIATTAFVQNVAGGLGTMSTQNSNNVNITGGSVTGVTLASASASFTGTPTAPTAAADTNTTQIATTAFVLGQGNTVAGTIAMNGVQAAGTSNLYARADHIHPTDTSRAPTVSPAFTGTPTAPTAAAGTNTTQIATTAFATTAIASAIPSGVIVMWSGSIASVPTGWYLCNGANGTPDLRDRFVVGAGSTYAVAATGGSKDAIVVSHTHTGTTASNGAHTHSTNQTAYIQSSTAVATATDSGSYRFDRTVLTTTSAGAHTHTFTTDTTGSSGTNANLPPYYALAYIMKA